MKRRLVHSRLFLFGGISILFLTFSLLWLLLIPPSNTPFTKVIYIKKGTPLRTISERLEQEGLIRSRHFFIALATVFNKKGKIKAGEYELHTKMLPMEVLTHLVKGQTKRHLITIVEGYTLAQIAQLLEESNIVEKKAFLQKATSPDFISSLGFTHLAGSTLEGYLFPDTYSLIKEMDPEEVIQIFVQRFKKVFEQEFSKRAEPPELSQREIVILASMIEKETSLPEEKPLISAVFHNRLRKKMPLQSDPTVIYGIKNFNGNLTKEHLIKPTPYNTYLKTGLPPTPICNPGRDSLSAAINPSPVPFLYFVSKNDGSHYFSSDMDDHNRAVWKYQKPPRR
ncbi:MAG: endolytic transglycosylase MltG [Thermodesulfobacteriota bacterium]